MIEYEVTNEPNQSFIISFEDTTIEVNLEFLVIPSCWIMNLTYKDEVLVQGMRLNSAVVALDTFNLPFDLFINDVNSLGLAPFDVNNFEDGLYTFNLLERDELEELRGYSVE